MIRVKASEVEDPWFLFRKEFQVGDIVERTSGGSRSRGKIVDAIYEGPPKGHQGRPYILTYEIESEDGKRYPARSYQLKKTPHTEDQK